MTAPHLRTPFVALGFLLENINRVVNRYRRFYYPPTGIPMAKPRFVRHDGRLVLVPNPIGRVEDMEWLGNAEFIRRLGVEDYWFARALPPPHFPRTAILLQTRFWVEAFATARREGIDPRPEYDLWADGGARELFFAILDAFADEVAAAGSRPIFLVLPTRTQIEQHRRGQPPPGLDRVLQYCRARGHPCFDGIGTLAAGDPAVPLESYYAAGGHLSPAGNEAVARAILGFFDTNGIGPRPVDGNVDGDDERGRPLRALTAVSPTSPGTPRARLHGRPRTPPPSSARCPGAAPARARPTRSARARRRPSP
jgi:hypothetical protein